MQPGRGIELLEQPLSPLADGLGDQIAEAVAGELALIDERNEQAARLGGRELSGDLLEAPDEGDELLGRVVGGRLGGGHEPVQGACVGLRVALQQGPPEGVLGREVVEEGPLRGPGGGQHGIDAGRREAALEDETLGCLEQPLAGGGAVAWHENHDSTLQTD
jgi:hypothetical protein